MKKPSEKYLFKKEILITICMVIVISLLSGILFYNIYSIEERRCWENLESNADYVAESITQRIMEDRAELRVMAKLISSFDSMESKEVRYFLEHFTPSTLTSQVALLLPGDKIILSSQVLENTPLSFSELSALGEHTTDRSSRVTEDRFVIRNFVPVIRDGETIAMLFGIIDLDELPDYVDLHIYKGEASIFLFDGNTGDDLINTWHDKLGNAFERGPRPVKNGYDYEQMQRDSFSGKTGHIIFSSKTAGEYLYYYYRPVDINNWSIALSVPESIVFKEALIVKRVLAAFVTAEIIALLCYLLWMLRHVKKTSNAEREKNIILEKALEQAEAAGRAKSTFLSNMSHDIRTPMNAIIGFTSIAATNIDNKERVKDCLGKISSSSNHLLALINDVLDMSKIESGDISLREDECNLSELMNDFTGIVQAQAASRDVALSCECDNIQHNNVISDSLRMNQMMLNLVGNAIKFTDSGGFVKIRLEEEPSDSEAHGNYRFTVEDSGVGISPEYLPQIFEAFTRETNSTINKIEGTGLGLPITKHIVDMMGGTINVESTPGVGTKFEVRFSLKLSQSREEASTPETPSLLSFEGKRILLAEDNELNREIATEILKGMELSVETAVNGKIAVEMLESSEPGYYDAVLMDVQMPVMNGYEATRAIRGLENSSHSSIPVIAMTANAFDEDKREAIENGMNAHIAKPIDLEVFIDTLSKALSEG